MPTEIEKLAAGLIHSLHYCSPNYFVFLNYFTTTIDRDLW